LPAEHIVCLLRDLAERLAKGNGVDSDDARRQLRAINHAARQVLVARHAERSRVFAGQRVVQCRVLEEESNFRPDFRSVPGSQGR
jgi:hypothetical protein